MRVDGGAGADAPATIAHVMTVPISLNFLNGQATYIREAGFSVHAIASPGPELARFAENEKAAVHAVAMTRRITPLRDLAALWHLWRTLRAIRPEIVHAHTAKAGLLGMAAAWLVRKPVRVYHLRGLAFPTAAGLQRPLLRLAERISCALAHRVLAVSHSIRDIVVDEGVCRPEKIRVLEAGSGNGVDAAGRFRPRGEAARREVRATLAIPPDAQVIGFVGRLVRDKGVMELAEAWKELRGKDPRRHLLLVGPFEAKDAIPPEVVRALESDDRVHLVGLVQDTPPLYAAMDVVALPTYREGFPNVALEAAAMALPIVATRVPGCVDAVRDGVTGTLVAPGDVSGLAQALQRYLSDPDLRARHGNAARRRVLEEFRPEVIWQAIAQEYRDLLGRREGATPVGRDGGACGCVGPGA